MDSIIDKIDKLTKAPLPDWHFPAENKHLSVTQLVQLSSVFACKLQDLGVNKQDRVGLVLNNCSDYVALLLAIWRINAVAVPLRPRGSRYTQTDKHLQYCDEVCDFRMIVYGDSMTEEAFSSWMTGPERTAISLEDLKAHESGSSVSFTAKITTDDLAILQFSSGSTGWPKGVMVTHYMMMMQLENLARNHTGSRLGIASASMASWTPVHHDLGLFTGILLPIYCNCLNILAPPSYYMRNPARWFSLLSEHRTDFTFTTNSALATTFNAISRLHNRDNIDLSNLHIYIAAEKVSAITVKRCWEIFAPLKVPHGHIHIGYGMAENTLGCACTRPPLISIRSFLLIAEKMLTPVDPDTPGSFELVSVGTADLNHEITVRDEQNRVLPELRLGEIHIKSPCISPGYYKNPALSAVTFSDGHFRSGDLGFYYQGELYFYARKDDMIITGGRNIIPNDIEESVESLPFVRPTTSCLVAREDKDSGNQELLLLIEANSNTEPEILEKQARTVQKQAMLDQDVLIQRVLFCAKGTIEKTSSGKKRRKVIRDRFLNNQLEIIGAKHGCTSAV